MKDNVPSPYVIDPLIGDGSPSNKKRKYVHTNSGSNSKNSASDKDKDKDSNMTAFISDFTIGISMFEL